MAMSATEIEKLIKDAFPDADVTITDLAGDNDHYAAMVTTTFERDPLSLWRSSIAT